MPLWSDNFDRADGPLGDNWVALSGNLSIVSNGAQCSAAATYAAGPISAAGAATAEVEIDWTYSANNAATPAVKISSNGANFYFLHLGPSGGNFLFQLFRIGSPSTATLATYGWAGPVGNSGILRLTYNAGVLTGFYNGVQMITANDSNHAAHTGVGMRFHTTIGRALSFSGYGDGQKVLIVTPSVVGTDDGETPIQLMATSTLWTPGTPGSPTFTANAGALSSQVVDSNTNARAIFSPPTTPQLVTISDASNGISDTITVVEGTYLGSGLGGVGGLTEAAIDWIEAQAAHGGLVLADNDTSGGTVSGVQLKNAFGEILVGVKTTTAPPTGYLPTADAVATIWDILNGAITHTSEDDVFSLTQAIDTNLEALQASFGAFRTPGTITVQDILDNLRGTGAYNHTDLYTAIQAVGEPNLQPIIDLLLAIRGGDTASIAYNQLILQAIAGTGGYSLDTVKTWVEAVRGTGLPTIRGVLDALATITSDISTITSKLALIQPDTQYNTTTLNQSVAGVATSVGTAIGLAEDILEIVQALQSNPATSGPPVWPGLANVTLGTQVAMSDGLIVTGPLHGVVLAITGNPPRAQSYDFGDVTSWSRAGAIIFGTDNGDYERSQTFSLETQVMVPQTMELSGSAIVRLNPGWSGTIRPWSRLA